MKFCDVTRHFRVKEVAREVTVLPQVVINSWFDSDLSFTLKPTPNFFEHRHLSGVPHPFSSTSKARRLRPAWDLTQLSDAPLFL